MSKIYYSQADPRWAQYPYPAPGYEDATVKSGGCGPTCAAMVVSSAGEVIYPDAMADICEQEGFRVSGGTSWDLFQYVADCWKLETREVHSSYEAFDACSEGFFVVANVGPGLWTTGGHYILLVGTRGDEIEVYDPYLYPGKFDQYGREGKVSVEGVSCFVQIDVFKEYSECKRFYAYKINSDEPTPGPEPSVDRGTVGQVMTFKEFTQFSEYPNGGGEIYDYKAGTTVIVLENYDATQDKIQVRATGREGYCDISAYEEREQSTVGEIRKFAHKTYIYSEPDLTGEVYTYLPNTTVRILENVSADVDKVHVLATGREGYVSTGVYA